MSGEPDGGDGWGQDTERAPGRGGGAKAGKPQRDQLVKIALAAATFWHDPDGEVYSTVEVDGHEENFAVRSGAFAQWIRLVFYQKRKNAPGASAVSDAQNMLGALAAHEGDEHEVFVRVAGRGEKIFIDLANQTRQVVEITSAGWEVIDDSPVKFTRPAGMRPLATPVQGGDLGDLRQFVNMNEGDFCLATSWLLATMRPVGPFPVLIVGGEQGSSKSTLARVMRELVDPNMAPIRGVPREARDLMISAKNSWVVNLDNLSKMQEWLSDVICSLATGSGYSARKLHSDLNEVIFQVARPAILNGIGDLLSRPDLADRALSLTLPSIPETARLPEKEFWAAFNAAKPTLFGALCGAVSAALANLDQAHLDSSPRMADFAAWIVAAEMGGALPWSAGAFMERYAAARAGAAELSVEGDTVAQAIRALVTTAPWEGTATELLTTLQDRVGERIAGSRLFPQQPNSMATRLRRVAPALRTVGVEVETGRAGKGRKRLISIREMEPGGGTKPLPPLAW